MKTILPLLLIGTLLQAQDKAALKDIGATYNQIEAEFKTWPHYTYSAENLDGGGSYQHHVWKSDGDNGFIKVESLNFDDHGESKVQFFFKGSDLVFTLDRSEESLIEEKTNEVIERRYYFAGNQLITLREKKGKFPFGKPTDTSALKNETLPVDAEQSASETYIAQHEIAAEVIERARRLDAEPAAAPASGDAGFTLAGEGWRVIVGSGSRDGKYALAWGLKDKGAADGDVGEDGSVSVSDETEGLINYLVDLTTKQIVGPINGKHFGDKSSYSHSSTETSWSAGSMFVAQVNSGQWATWDATIYNVRETDAAAISAGTDLLEPTKKALKEHLADHDLIKKHGHDAFALTLHDVALVMRNGVNVASIEVDGQIPKSEEDTHFACTMTFKIESDENDGPPKLTWIGSETHHD